MPIVHKADKARVPEGWAYATPLTTTDTAPESLDSIAIATEVGRMVAVAREDAGERTERLSVSPSMGAAVVTRDPERPSRAIVTLAAESARTLADDGDWARRIAKRLLDEERADLVYLDACQVLLDAHDPASQGLFASLDLPTDGPGKIALCLHTSREVLTEPGRLFSKAIAERLRSTDPDRWLVHLPIQKLGMEPAAQARVLETAAKTGAMLQVAEAETADAEWAGHGFAYMGAGPEGASATYVLTDTGEREGAALEALVIAEATGAVQRMAKRLREKRPIPWRANLPDRTSVSGEVGGDPR